jgi:ABC-type lipoprotein export system ATPase subunit
MTLIRAEHVVKTYRSGEVEVPAIRGVDFTIDPRSFVVFVGPSGSGKTTLLNMIGCLDHPTGGKLTVLDTDVGKLDRAQEPRTLQPAHVALLDAHHPGHRRGVAIHRHGGLLQGDDDR